MPSKPFYLIIAHNIFLERSDRYALSKKTPARIGIVGWCVPVWCGKLPLSPKDKWHTDEPADEVFCRYTLTNEAAKRVVQIQKTGFRINLGSKNICRGLLDLKDAGKECAHFVYRARTRINHKAYRIMHFVNINRIEQFKETLMD